MNPDLRAIEATLLGEPHDPSNLSPEAASVVLPLVRRVVRERDDGRREIDVLRRERHAERQRVDERDQQVAQLREEMEEERRTSEERRLALLAECLDPEGGADLGFTPVGGKWFKPDGERDKFGLWPRWWVVYRDSATANITLELREHGRYVTAFSCMTQRAAMLAADKALFESRRTRCLAKVRQLQSDGVILYPPNGTHQQTPAIMIDRLSDPDLTEAVLAIYEKVLFP